MTPKISQSEFIAMMAMMVATVAFSIDSMLPALPVMAQDLTPEAPNRAQLVLSAFFVGMGVGTLFTGPLSDAFGRKTIINLGAALYILGAVLAWAAPTIELMVAARIMQGIGAAGPRIVSIAIIRDLYSGREMARIVSFVMLIFTIVPSLAPLLGSGIIALGGWRGIFVAFVIFAVISSTWVNARLSEPLPVGARRPLNLTALWTALKEMMSYPMVRNSIYVQLLIFSVLFTSISLIQPTFDQIFGKADQFALYFFAIGIFCASSSVVNATFVMRLGMRAIISIAIFVTLTLTLLMLALHLSGVTGTVYFWAYVLWQTAIFFQMGLTIGNLNALAMEPLGHIAGLAASVMGAISTVAAGVIATLIAQMFDGTTLPQIGGVLVLLALAIPALVRMRSLDRPLAAPVHGE
ncbi:MFS transporter [Primorskyibacter flagellatus]|uniref:MFS transporter n=1 Tax=Primorskyibacter flagellatus TaxID=1387277 RepID=A0A917A464_9RHOB|nr:MFS transporter [Primorskyibacter flagellatus]GGE24153.1 MFS transporter [Primorskyibacter flagellatus]